MRILLLIGLLASVIAHPFLNTSMMIAPPPTSSPTSTSTGGSSTGSSSGSSSGSSGGSSSGSGSGSSSGSGSGSSNFYYVPRYQRLRSLKYTD